MVQVIADTASVRAEIERARRLRDTGDYRGAQACLRWAISEVSAVLGPDAPEVGEARAELARCLAVAGGALAMGR